MAEVQTELVELAPSRPGEELDEAAVLRFLAPRARELDLEETPASLTSLQFKGGRANLTYLVRLGGRELVLRRPPLGAVAHSAHDMVREFRVLSRLWRAFDRAPRAFVLCDDASVIGAPFFLMERRDGAVIRDEIPAALRSHADVERRTTFALIDAMADLHAVDYAALGLADLGRPAGFLERQLAGWSKRWDQAKDRELPDFEALRQRLQAQLPVTSAATLVHNDFKLDNCQFDPAVPDRVKSLFDWDMTTLGDPLADLGTLLGYMSAARNDPENTISATSIFARPGFPSRDEVIGRYATRSEVELTGIGWFEAFALWKSAVILQQIFIRYQRGQTTDERFAGMGARVPELLALGLALAPDPG
jgi:aminoglycoside phosphotransferase (APT) family kinase protein